MPHVDHPKVVEDRIIVRVRLPDPTVKHVLRVETKMPMTAHEAGFDQEKYDGFIKAVRAAMDRTGAHEAEIVSASRSLMTSRGRTGTIDRGDSGLRLNLT